MKIRLGRAAGARRTAVLGVATVTAVGAVTAGTVATAAEAPAQVLQAVDVQLGTDGSVQAITGKSVSRTSGQDPEARTEEYDAVEAAADLPVRITTAYRVGDRAGSDLADIEGASGRVVVEVTVQNTTVKPESLSYDSGGVSKRRNVLVGTPLTVIGSGVLEGAGEGTEVITDDESSTEPATNGVLSIDGAGDPVVQWAAVLAPPRLGATTTFRLVQQTDDFQPPQLDISVQPGLLTDTSVRNLLDEAFSRDDNSAVSLESRTITLLGEVNTVLAQAGLVLNDIQSGLDESVNSLATRTIADLQSSSDAAATSLNGLVGDLDSMQRELAATLKDGNDRTLRGLQDTLGGVKKLLGDPRTTKHPTTGRVDGCDVPALAKGATPSVLSQLYLVGAQLDTLTKASAACSDQIEAGLSRTVGVASDSTDCSNPDAESAICVLDRAQAGLAERAMTMASLKTEILGDFDTAKVARLGAELASVVQQVKGIQATADKLDDGGTTAVDPVLDGLSNLLVAVGNLRQGLANVDVSRVLNRFSQVSSLASAQLNALGDAGTSDSIIGRAQALTGLVTAVCNVPADVAGTDQSIQDYLTATRAQCQGADTTTSQLMAGLNSMVDGWTQVRQLADVSNISGDLTGNLDDFENQVASLEQMISGSLRPEVGNVKDHVRAVRSQVRNLYRALLDDGTTCPGDGPADGEPPLDALVRTYKQVQCNTAGLVQNLDGHFAEVDGTLVESQKDLASSITATDEARQKAVETTRKLTTDLGANLGEASHDVQVNGRRQVERMRAGLDDQFEVFGKTVDSTTSDAINGIGAEVGSANRDLDASEQMLTSDIMRVLIDLGSREQGGAGILGTLLDGAAQSAVAEQQIGEAQDRSTAFANVRSQQLDQVFLEQAQTTRSLVLAQQFPAFGLDLPAGSTHLTVFSYHLSAE